MRRTILFTILTLALAALPAFGQDEALSFEQILENDARQNLNVARHYFKQKKAYKAVLSRFEETFAAHPSFSRMDEFLYYAGMSSVYLSENKGKQKVNLADEDERRKFDPARLRENAIAYFALIIENFPKSKFEDEAREMLKQLDPDYSPGS